MTADAATWEHLIVYLEADAQQQEPFLQQTWPGECFPKFAAQALIPPLDYSGQQGWELVSIQPVVVGDKGDILINDGRSGAWTSTYLCVFKRPK
jgi:hypothetical protein